MTYLKEEIWNEHLVEDLEPFRLFLEVSAQTNGTIVNYHKIARDVNINEKTVKRYFEILEETLVGFYLNAYSRSIRKRQSVSPKFYLFDTGVTRALARFLGQKLVPKSAPYGNAFEHFVISEAFRLNDYNRRDYRLSYFRTKDGVEIDLVIERPGLPLALIEIKSTTTPSYEDASHLHNLRKEFGECDVYLWSNQREAYIENGITFLNWQDGMKAVGLY